MGIMTGFAQGFVYAWRGILYVFHYERNARVHLLFAVLAFSAGLYLQISGEELAAIFFAIILVFLAEIFNTAIEKTLDLIDTNHNRQIMIVKDMAAGGVLVSAIAAIIIGIVVLGPHLVKLWHN